MLQAIRRLFLLALLFPIGLIAQGYSYQNFSHGTPGAAPTTTDLAASMFGTIGTGTSWSVSNSASALTYTSSSSCTDGGPQAKFHSGNFLHYNTTNGAGHNNQFVQFFMPNEAGALAQGFFWFCTTVPATAVFGTSFDGFQFICGFCGSRLSNYDNQGAGPYFTTEGVAGVQTVPFSVGQTVGVAWQQFNGAPCVNFSTINADHSDCTRLQLFDRTMTKIGEMWTNGGTGGNCTPGSCDITFGNGNAINVCPGGGACLPSGFMVEYSDVWLCAINCSNTEFPTNPSPPWFGILTPGRATDFTQAGFPGSTLPDASWPQCVTTACNAVTTAGAAVTDTQINAALASAGGSSTYVQLPAGTLSSIAGQITFPTSGYVVLRGAGASQTILPVPSGLNPGCAGAVLQSFICVMTNAANNVQSRGTVFNWTAGYNQAATSITLSGTTGINTTASATPTIIALDLCDTGLNTGNGCTTGTNTDNGNLFICTSSWSSPNGCAVHNEGGDNNVPNRGQIEFHTASAVNSGTGVVTLNSGLLMPNITSGRTPQAWLIQPVPEVGVENLRVDGVNNSVIGALIGFGNIYKGWVSGVEISNAHLYGFNCVQCFNTVFKDNVVDHVTQATNPYGVRFEIAGFDLIQNNIIRQASTPFSYDGPATGNVFGYNYIIWARFTTLNNLMQASENYHSANYMNLDEGNTESQSDCDGIHATCGLITRYRNLFTGWESQPGQPENGGTNGIVDSTFDRTNNNVANLVGSAIYHTGYLQSASCTNYQNFTIVAGVPAACDVTNDTGVPTETTVFNSTLYWGNYDVKTAAVRYCGNSLDTGWSTTCSSASESPSTFSTFPNFVPVIGDTAIGEPAYPASLYLTAKPSWFGSTPFPVMGPDVTSGNLGVCTGTINTVGQFAGVATTSSSQCTGTTLATGWAGHANANPALNCYLNVLGGAPDGSGSVITNFNAASCYGGGPTAPIATFTPSTVAFGLIPFGLTGNPITVTLQNTGTANLVVTSVTPSSAVFTLVNNTCGTSFTLTPSSSCTFQLTATPASAAPFSGNITFADNAGNPDVLSLNGTGNGNPAIQGLMFAQSVIITQGII